MSSRNAPYVVDRVVARMSVASTASVFAPASVATWSGPSANRVTCTSSTAPVK